MTHVRSEWWLTAMEELTCPKCKETRLVALVQDKRGTQAYCQVCAKSWPVPPITESERYKRTVLRTVMT